MKMKMYRVSSLKLTILTLVFCLLGNVAYNSVPVHAAQWNLAWHDEFDQPTLDTSNWNYETGANIRNNELQYYTSRPENVRVEGGNLVLECRKENYGGKQYTSGSITTENKRNFKYAKIEMRAKLPQGKGIWPGFWTTGYGQWPACGEIDIMEMIGGGTGFDNTIFGTLHYDDDGHKQMQYWAPLTSGIYADMYHTFSVIWNSDKISFYMDDWNYFNCDTSGGQFSEFDVDHFLRLNLAIGGDWPAAIGKTPDSSTVLPQKMLVDYVRCYYWQ